MTTLTAKQVHDKALKCCFHLTDEQIPLLRKSAKRAMQET